MGCGIMEFLKSIDEFIKYCKSTLLNPEVFEEVDSDLINHGEEFNPQIYTALYNKMITESVKYKAKNKTSILNINEYQLLLKLIDGKEPPILKDIKMRSENLYKVFLVSQILGALDKSDLGALIYIVAPTNK